MMVRLLPITLLLHPKNKASNLLAAVFLVAITNITAAQQFSGKAWYILKNPKLQVELGNALTDAQKKEMQEKLDKASLQYYTLKFDNAISVFEEDASLVLTSDKMKISRTSSSLNDQPGKIFKDIRKKTQLIEKEFLGKQFLIKDSLVSYNWKITGDTKKIGDYTCYMAKAFVEDKDMAYIVKQQKSHGFTTSAEVSGREITAWFTTDIPLSHGPQFYWGLPGLILEVNDGKKILLCSKVLIDGRRTDISFPNADKAVTEDQYHAVVMKKLQQMEDMD